MSDQPLTVGVFEGFQKVFQEFQRKVFDQFTAVDRRFEVLQRNMDARFDEVTGQLRRGSASGSDGSRKDSTD